MHFADAIYSFLSNQFNNLVVLEVTFEEVPSTAIILKN